MKRVLPLLLALLLALSLAVPAFAEDDVPSPDPSSGDASSPDSFGDPDTGAENPAADAPDFSGASSPDTSLDSTVTADSTTSDDGGVTVNVTIQQPETPTDESPSEVSETPLENLPVSVLDGQDDTSAYRTFTVVSPDDDEAVQSPDGSTVMADVVVSILGEYRRKTQTVTEMDSDGNILAVSTEIVPGLAGLDYKWIAGASFFGLFLLALMKLIGGLIKL